MNRTGAVWLLIGGIMFAIGEMMVGIGMAVEGITWAFIVGGVTRGLGFCLALVGVATRG